MAEGAGHRLGRWRVFLALGLAFATPVVAQEAAQPAPEALPLATGIAAEGLVVLLLDQDRMYAESRRGQAVEAVFVAQNEALAEENRRIDAALEAEERDLTTRRPLLAAEDFQALAGAFDEKVEGLRQAQATKARSLEAERETARQAFLQDVVPILGQIMTETGAVAILDRSAVILSFDRIDITDLAIERLDALPDAPAPQTAPSP